VSIHTWLTIVWQSPLSPERDIFWSARTGLLSVPRTRTTLGMMSFTVAGPVIWNSLPAALRTATLTPLTFGRHVKAHPAVWLIDSPSEDYLWRALQIHSSSSSSLDVAPVVLGFNYAHNTSSYRPTCTFNNSATLRTHNAPLHWHIKFQHNRAMLATHTAAYRIAMYNTSVRGPTTPIVSLRH